MFTLHGVVKCLTSAGCVCPHQTLTVFMENFFLIVLHIRDTLNVL